VRLAEIVTSPDGSLSLTKLAASTAHALMAGNFAYLSWRHGFNAELWIIYGSFAIGHATVDKTVQVVKSYKDNALNSGATK